MSRKVTLAEAIAKTESRHVLGLSGGKDSAALAIYIRDKYPELHEKVEYFSPIPVQNWPRFTSSLIVLKLFLVRKSSVYQVVKISIIGKRLQRISPIG